MEKVRVKDYNRKIHKIKTALNMVGINIDYTTTELLLASLEAVKKMGSKFSLDDATNIQFAHREKWEKYFDKLEKGELTDLKNDQKALFCPNCKSKHTGSSIHKGFLQGYCFECSHHWSEWRNYFS